LLAFLARPALWVPAFLILAVLTPPVPLGDFPVHGASLLFAVALPAMVLRGLAWGRDRLSWSFLLFLGVLLFSTVLAFFYSGGEIGVQSLLRWLLLSQAFVLFAWIAYGPEGTAPEPGSLLRLLLWLGLAAAIVAVVDFYVQIPPTVRFADQYIYLPDGPRRRAQGFFYDASALGAFCALLLLCIATLILDRDRPVRVPRWLLWTAAPPLAAALVVSFSRGAILNLLGGLAVLLLWQRRRLLEGRAVAIATATLAGAGATLAAAAWAAPDIVRIFFLRLQFSTLQFFTAPNQVLSQRVSAWQYLLEFMLARPEHFLLGIGYKTLPYTRFLGRSLVGDNMYVSLLVECGVVGLSAFLIMCAFLLRQAWRYSRSRDPLLALLGGFVLAAWCGMMLQMLSGDTLTLWRVTPVFFVPLGLAVRRSRQLS
jgi:O-antigen ligase